MLIYAAAKDVYVAHSRMERVQKTVFLCYRRITEPWALAIFHDLTHHGFDVFMDYASIGSGDFEQIITENINTRAHFIVLLTPSALQRCDEPGDWLRREIETAIYTQRNIVPIMLEAFDFGMPSIARQLTGSLGVLKRYNSLSVPQGYFPAAMARLRGQFLNMPVSAVLHPVSQSALAAAQEQQRAATAAEPVQADELTAQQWVEKGLATADFEEALRFYSNAIRLKPDYHEAFYNRGKAYQDNGHLAEAINDYNEALRLHPAFPFALGNRGMARGDTDDLDGGLADLNEAIRLAPGNPISFNNRGRIWLRKEALDDAIKDFDEAIRLKPDYDLAFNNRGLARLGMWDFRGAMADFSKAARLNPHYSKACTNLGRAHVLMDAFEDVMNNVAFENSREDARFLMHLLQILNPRLSRCDFAGAIDDFDHAVRQRPHDAFGFLGRAISHAALGHTVAALEDYTEVVRLKPDLAGVASMLLSSPPKELQDDALGNDLECKGETPLITS